MPFPVSLCRGAVSYEALPVAKITNYPLEKADYKPFAQALLCVRGDRLCLRMWAFEVYSSPESELRCVLGLFREPRLTLHISAAAEESVRVAAWVDGATDKLPVPTEHRPYNGEDLQGVYWGAEIEIPFAGFPDSLPLIPLKAWTSFPGNFYKLRRDEPYIHMGSFYPAAFPDLPFSPESMDVFTVTPY